MPQKETKQPGVVIQLKAKKAATKAQKKAIKTANKYLKKNPIQFKIVQANLGSFSTNDVTIKQTPEENDGCLCAVLPKGWFKIAPPKKINLSEEDRAKRSARALAAREARAKKRGA